MEHAVHDEKKIELDIEIDPYRTINWIEHDRMRAVHLMADDMAVQYKLCP